MTTEESIIEQIHSLPASSKKKVLHFVQLLKSKSDLDKSNLYDSEWQDFSLNSAMKDIKEETTPYTAADITMPAEKTIIETDSKGRPKSIPHLPPNKRFETIFLFIGEAESDSCKSRQPCIDLKGSIKINGDIFSSAPEESWDLPR